MTQQRGEQEIRAALTKVWLDSQARVRERLATLEEISASLRAGVLNEECREDAMEAAHRLSGALGMFGFHEASTCAAEIESLLAQVPESVAFAQLVARLRGLLENTETPHTADLENRSF